MFGPYRALVDLTMPVVNDMDLPPAVRKSTPPVRIHKLKDADTDGCQVSVYQSGIHAGTHLDAPLHMVPGGCTIDQLPLERFFGTAYCVDCTEVGPNEAVTDRVLAKAEGRVRPGMIVLLCTGWSDKMFGTDAYWFDSPVLAPSGARWLVDHGVKMAGYDFFQDEAAKADVIRPEDYVVHKILLSNDCLNIEHLVHLGEVVGQEFWFCALPLRLSGAEGSPTRAVAFLP